METDSKYAAWIAANVKEANPLGLCQHYAKAMADAFSELRVVSGHYYCEIWGPRGHWWCVTPEGQIVDPTKRQFPSGGTGRYEEYTGDGSDLPTGVCADCGTDVFNGDTFCSEACERRTRHYLMNAAGW